MSFCAKPSIVGVNQANALACAVALAADRDDAQTRAPRRIDHLLRAIMIGGDHRGAIRPHEIAEQPQLGVEIMRDIGMIIHVVARQIGKTAGGDPHAVEPELVEAVRGSLEGEMGDAVACDLVELAMQRDRIGRRQRAVDGALRRHQRRWCRCWRKRCPSRCQIWRVKAATEVLPLVPVTAAMVARLPRIKFRRRQRQRAARIRRGDERHAAAVRRMIARDRNGARGNRRIDEARAVGLAAGQREEQVARLHRAAVHREARRPRPSPACGSIVASSLKRSRSLMVFQPA